MLKKNYFQILQCPLIEIFENQFFFERSWEHKYYFLC